MTDSCKRRVMKSKAQSFIKKKKKTKRTIPTLFFYIDFCIKANNLRSTRTKAENNFHHIYVKQETSKTVRTGKTNSVI